MTTTPIRVKKRDNTLELLDPEKIHKILFWATQDITGVSPSEIELQSHIMFYDEIATTDIHKTLVKAATQLVISEVNYAKVAARLKSFNLRKEVYGQYDPLPLYEMVVRNVEKKVYDPELLTQYTKAEFDLMDSFIRHDRDDKFEIGGIEQVCEKYLVKNRVTKQIYETPQMMYMLVAAGAFMYDTDRMHHIKKFYNILSTFKIGTATPILAGLRTRTRQFSSCVLIDCDDHLDSIIAMTGANVKYVSKRAGLGNNVGRIRPEHSEIRDGEASHTGLLPFIKLFKQATKSCSQGGIRGGAMTAYYPAWHYDFEQLIVLKNNKGTEETRERHIDYGVQFNSYLLKRFISGQPISLFSPTLPGLYESFFNDQAKFAELYEKYEADPLVPKRIVPSSKWFKWFMNERASTNRVYYMITDLANEYSPFDTAIDPIYMSNLCCLSGDAEIDIRFADQYYRLQMDEFVERWTMGFYPTEVFVKSWNGNESVWKVVENAALTKRTDDLLEIETDTGEIIRCTPDHKLFTKNRGWVEAQHLLETDDLQINYPRL